MIPDRRSKPGAARVTIVTPSLNQGRFVQAAIESVLYQDYPNIDYMVLDGGSSDETVDVLRSFGTRLTWASEPDEGQADAVNVGFAQSSGEHLAWLNADDVYLPGAITAMAAYLDENPQCAMVYGRADLIDIDGAYLKPAEWVETFSYHRLLNDLDFIVQPATLIRRSAFDLVGGLDARLHWSFDYDLWLKLARRHEIGFLDRPLAQVRLHSETKTAKGGLDRLLEVERVVARHGRAQLPTHFQGQMVRARWLTMMAAARERRARDIVLHARSGFRYLGAHLVNRAARRR